ncbi:MAG: gliding motility-associated C-terminal domain-containing protein [Bacteroidetes bacterium]|nr:gliding motility-associated C-terminal domain-containing protein [Bacteroidota bacterium]
MKRIFYLILIIVVPLISKGQGSTCETADPFCSGSGVVFPNTSDSSFAQTGPNYGCLNTQPNPAWYYMQIGNSGSITMEISQTDNLGSGIDVDFIIWGPFSSLTNVCTNLNGGNIVDCSYSPDAVETATISNAISGEFYMVLITNYSGDPGTIDFSQTPTSTGTSDCNVLNPCLAFAGNDTTICIGESVTLGEVPAATGNGNFTYSWTPTTGISDSTASNPIATPTQTTTYYLTMVDDSSCTATDSITVNVLNPIANAGLDDTLTCSNPTINLDGSTSTTGLYSWSSIGGAIISGGNTIAPLVGQTGFYILEVNELGCIDTDTVQVFQDSTLPIVNAGNDTSLTCIVDTIQLSGFVSGTNLVYYWTGPSIISGDSTLTPLINGVGSYVLTAKDTVNGCQLSSTVHVFDDRTPPVVAVGSSSDLTCVIQSVTLDGTGSDTGVNISYEWTTTNGSIVSGLDSIFAVTNTAGTYFLTVYDSLTGCFASDSIVVAIDTILPIANAGADTSLNCYTLVNGGVPIDGTDSQSGTNITYQWNTPDGNIVTGASSNYALVNAPGTYTITVTNTTNGCVNSDDVLVVIDTIKPIADAGVDMLLDCNNPTVMLNGTGSSSGSNITYLWSGNPTDSTTITPIINSSGTYTLTVSNTSNMCTASDAAVVTADFTAPGAFAGLTETICPREEILLTGNTTSGDIFVWTTTDGNIVSGDSTLTPTINAGGTYTLTTTNTINGCTDSSNVFIQEIVVSAIIGANPTSGMMPLTVDFVNLGVADSSYWDFANGQTFGDTSTISSSSIIYNEQGTYVVTLTSTVGECSISTNVTIEVIGVSMLIVPNVFTPNGDDKNDVFEFNYKNITELNCVIFNRWGKQVAEITAPDKSWDGKNGSDGTYFYVLKAKGLDDIDYNLKGTISLIR